MQVSECERATWTLSAGRVFYGQAWILPATGPRGSGLFILLHTTVQSVDDNWLPDSAVTSITNTIKKTRCQIPCLTVPWISTSSECKNRGNVSNYDLASLPIFRIFLCTFTALNTSVRFLAVLFCMLGISGSIFGHRPLFWLSVFRIISELFQAKTLKPFFMRVLGSSIIHNSAFQWRS
jgi:hypothetical protein